MAPALPRVKPLVSTALVATTFAVDTASDPVTGTSCASGHDVGTCSLRAAVAASDADSGNIDAITIPAGMHVLLTQSATLNLTNSMSITGGAGSSVNGERAEVFNQSNAPAVQISGIIITGGVTTGNGGGMYCGSGSLVLAGVTFADNQAANGGGLYTSSHCQLWVSNSVFSRNVATGALAAPIRLGAEPSVYAHGNGGGIYLYGSALIVSSTFGGATDADANLAEEGAGIYNYDGDVSLINSTVSHNASPSTFGYGVGVYNDEVMDISGSSIDHNTAPYGADGVGIDVEYLTTITNTSISNNSATGDNTTYGGGLYDDGDATTLTNVSFTDNSVKPSAGESVYGGAVLSYAYQLTWHGGSITGTNNGLDGASDFIEGGALYLDGSHATVEDVTITGTTNNSLPDEYPEGGAVYINEYTAFNHVTIADTTNRGYNVYGGAIYNDDYSSLTNVTITNTDNHATYTSGGYIAGGVLYNDGDNSTFTNFNADMTTNLADGGLGSQIDGGAVYNDYESTASGVVFTNVSAVASGGSGTVYGGVLYNDESLIVRDSQFLGATVQADRYVEGGLVYNDDRLNATNFTLGNSTVTVLGGPDAGTPYAYGAFVYNDSQTALVNTTLSNVVATVPSSGEFAYGIDNQDLLQMTNSTIANDSITGPSGSTWLLYAGIDSQASLLNTIVSSSAADTNCSNGGGTGKILSAGYDLDNGTTCQFANTGDLQSTDPLVADLANNGGSILTAALETGSPAVDHGTNNGCPPTDARGVSRPIGPTCDIGAFEATAGLPVTITGSTVYGTGSVTFQFHAGTLPTGVTGVAGPLAGCATTVTAATTPGVYQHTISGCQGLTLQGPSAGNYQISYVDGGVTVTKASTLTTLVKSPASPGLNQAVTFTATVTKSSGAAALTGTVSFYVNGSATPVAVKSISGNTAVMTTTFGGGSQKLIATYSGDGNYLASTSTARSVSIACTTTITGTHGGVIALSGATCLRNATISGSIIVSNGASLDIENSKVSGSVSASAPRTLRVCGSTTGAITSAHATAFVLIGDPTNNCAANTVNGSITLTYNTGGLVVIGNTVSGSFLATNNSGTSPLGQPVTITGNHH